ncbi:MAG: alpha/beta hydrolase, partial [Rhodospirillales bacterium]
MSLWTASILAIVLAYGGLVGALYLGQRKLIYRPESHQPGPEEAGLGRLTVVRYQSADGLELNGWHRPAKPGKPTLLYFQGNAGTFVDRADKVNAFLDHGLGVLLAGYRGYGGNPGRPSEAGLNQDADAALNYLLSQSPKNGEEQIVLYGESLGT